MNDGNQTDADDSTASDEKRFPVVVLGASAGGLEALRQLLGNLPDDTGLAFVVIQHLSPDQPSMLSEVLRKSTSMPVVEVTDDMPLKPDRVHVIPSNAEMGLRDGRLQLGPRSKTKGLHLPIDSFCRRLAEDYKRRAMGVVLSGTGHDGTEGLRAIKEAGGITLAQTTESAQFDAMPRSAIDAGVVDVRGQPSELARELVRLSKHPYTSPAPQKDQAETDVPSDEKDGIADLVRLMRQHADMDYDGYKRSSMRRRILRRVAVRRVGSIAEYAEDVKDDPAEIKALAQDLLLHVTSFFRDPEAFEALSKKVLAPLGKAKNDGDTIRVWVAGCSTGEEVYSLGICLLEALAERASRVTIKIFGTDLSAAVIDVARRGVYSEADLADVSRRRREAFFDPWEGGYRISQRVRDLCVFVKHDLTSDPPFVRLDLLSCRNLLIYFDADLQKRVMPMLHYSLAPEGHLFLGKSETIGSFPELFSTVDGQNRIFRKEGESRRFAYPAGAGRDTGGAAFEQAPELRQPPARGARRQADHFMLARFGPPGAVVDERFRVVDFRGHTGVFLETPPGQPEDNVLRLAREGLRAPLREALALAVEHGGPVRREKLRVASDAGDRVFDLEVVPLAAGKDAQRFFLVLFLEENGRPPARLDALSRDGATGRQESERLAQLRLELFAAKDHLRAVVAENQNNTDDLAAVNEELIASNEEMQSTNEELQSAKEELQSTNEELGTVNDELRSRNVDLDRLANDLVNVLASVKLPVIIVDLKLRVRRFTPTVEQVANMLSSDVGRSIDDIKLKVRIDDLAERVREVIRHEEPSDWEITDSAGRWLRLQIRPYRTLDARLDGAVLTFVDVDELKRALLDTEEARDQARRIIETMPVALVVLDEALRIVSANPTFVRVFALPSNGVDGRPLSEVANGALSDPRLLARLSPAAKIEPFSDFETEARLPTNGVRIVSVSGRTIPWAAGEPMTLLAIVDVTRLRRLERERTRLLVAETEAKEDAERANQAKDLFLATLSHELRTPLSTLLMHAQLLKRLAKDDPRLARTSGAIERAAASQSRLINDLLDVSRIISGKLHLDSSVIDLRDVVENAVDVAQPSIESKELRLEVDLGDFETTVYGDALRLQQVVANLLTNAVKFTPRDGRVTVRLARLVENERAKAELTVADTGIGIEKALLPRLFQTFVQADAAMTRAHGGLGLGLALIRHITEAHGGEVGVESEGADQGSTFRVTLPLVAGTPAVAPDSAPARDLDGLRVLLVEDDDDARDALAALLEQQGCDVWAAASAEEGLAAMDAFRPRFILSDIAMPGHDGYDFIRQVRKRAPRDGGRVPAIALTALASEDDRRKAIAAGFQLHLAKPIDLARLTDAVARLLAEDESGEE